MLNNNPVKTINLKCNGQVLTVPYKNTIASGGINNVKCQFAFSDDWDELSKTAVFTTDRPYKQELDEHNECFIPAPAMAQPGVMGISVYGELGGEIRNTSTVVQYEIAPGADVDAVDPFAQVKDDYRTELVNALKANPHITDNADNLTWEQLKSFLCDIIIASPEEYETATAVNSAVDILHDYFSQFEITNDTGLADPPEVIESEEE